MSYGLTRRSLLRALGAAAVALPALEVTQGRAQSTASPKRFVMLYAGLSPAQNGSGVNLLRPNEAGAAYTLPPALACLGAEGFDVREDVSVVSGLKVPWDTGAGIPPGGRSPFFHYNTGEMQTTGMRGDSRRGLADAATSADIIVADAIGEGTAHRSLSYRIQAERYQGGATDDSGGVHALSLRRRANGTQEELSSTASPSLIYETLFGGFIPEDAGSAEVERAVRLRRRRRQVLDGVHVRTASLMSRLGHGDRARVEQHLDGLSSLESRLRDFSEEPAPTGSTCVVPGSVGADPESGISRWNDEVRRGELIIDLVSAALECDLTRSVAIRVSKDQTFMNARELTGFDVEMHQLTHTVTAPKRVALEKVLDWHASHFARLVSNLRDAADGEGSVLDSTAAVMLFEGGAGYDPETGSSRPGPHSTENMVALIGGHAGDLGGGQNIVTTDAHPAQVVASAMEAVGLEDRLGEVSGRIPELFG